MNGPTDANGRGQLELFASSFESEADLRGAIHDLLLRLPYPKGVQVTHGPMEHGKDMVFHALGALGEPILCACVIKNSKLSGSVSENQGAMTVFHQVSQALKIPFINPDGQEERVSRVYVITPHPISQFAMASIQGELADRSGQVRFTTGQDLLDLFETYYPDYLLLKCGFLTSYVSALRQTFDDSGPLRHLSIKHGMLGAARRGTSRVYVRPEFHIHLRTFRKTTLAVPHPGALSKGITANQIADIDAFINKLETLLTACAEGAEESIPELSTAPALRSEIRTLATMVRDDYAAALSKLEKQNEKHTNGSDVHTHAGGGGADELIMKRGNILQKRLTAAVRSSREIINAVVTAGSTAAEICSSTGLGLDVLRSPSYATYCLCRELSSVAPAFLLATDVLRSFTLDESLLDAYGGSVLISGPAGYGKTSFCKWSALFDGENFASGRSNVLPVYVALHRLSQVPIDSLGGTFWGPEIQSAIDARRHANNEVRIRLYLDGLDEVPEGQQRSILSLAKAGLESYRGLQIVVTAREHVTGPWLSWLPRVHIAEFDERRVRDLVTQLLNSNDLMVARFFAQLEAVPSLKPLLRIPLLCTLTTSLFLGSTTLPEGRVELYRIFVDLMCGGWDEAKGVRRDSRFSASEKLRFLLRLATVLHARRLRSVKAVTLREIARLRVWEALVADIVQDGLLSRDGDVYTFAHLSFQEYLCARDLADASTNDSTRVRAICNFLGGEDWWREVIMFYAGMSHKPDVMLKLIRVCVRELAADTTRPTVAQRVEARAMELVFLLKLMFPAEFPDVDPQR